jgi:hypothetical protein
MNLKAPHLAEAGERSLWGFLFVPQGHFLAQPSADLTARCKGPLMAVSKRSVILLILVG